MTVHDRPREPLPIPEDFPVSWEADEQRLFFRHARDHFPTPINPLDFAYYKTVLEYGVGRTTEHYEGPIVGWHLRRLNTYFYQSMVPYEGDGEEAVARSARSEQKILADIDRLHERWTREILPEIGDHLAYSGRGHRPGDGRRTAARRGVGHAHRMAGRVRCESAARRRPARGGASHPARAPRLRNWRRARGRTRRRGLVLPAPRRCGRRHGVTFIERQLDQKRLADAATDLYAQLAVVARTSQLLADGDAVADDVARSQVLAEAFCARAARQVNDTLYRVERNDDAQVAAVAGLVRNRGMASVRADVTRATHD